MKKNVNPAMGVKPQVFPPAYPWQPEDPGDFMAIQGRSALIRSPHFAGLVMIGAGEWPNLLFSPSGQRVFFGLRLWFVSTGMESKGGWVPVADIEVVEVWPSNAEPSEGRPEEQPTTKENSK